MKKNLTQRGQSLFELVIAMGIFAIGIVTILYLGADSGVAVRGGVERTQATFLAQEGIEAVRSIRDYDFAELVDGEYGLAISGGTWTLSGTSDTQDQFTRTVTIAPTDDDLVKQVTTTVTWDVSPTRTESVSFDEYISNWNRGSLTEIECFHVDLSGASIEQGDVGKIVRYIWISNPSCGYDINLDKIVVTWDMPTNNIFKVRIAQFFKWQGNAPSGTVLDLVPNETLVSGGAAKEIDQLRWKDTILETDIGVTFIMSDGSEESFVIPAFPPQ